MQKPPVSLRRENIPPVVDANVESTHTWGSVGLLELENRRAMLYFRCDVEKGAVARGSIARTLAVCETFPDVWMLNVLSSREIFFTFV